MTEEDYMRTNVELGIRLWAAPNFVLVKNPDPTGQDMSLPLRSVDANTLELLCDRYRDEIFKKAGKPRPPQAACSCGRV